MAVWKEAPVEPMTAAEQFGVLFDTLQSPEVLIPVALLAGVVGIGLARLALSPRRRRTHRLDDVYGMPRADDTG